MGGPGSMPPKNFFAALFDFSFSGFATFTFVKILYILGMIFIGLAYVGYVVFFFNVNVGAGLLVLIVGAVFALFALAFLRLSLEFYYAVARMSEDIHNRR
ncbi:DUF4282 domain-containing protein [Pseudonocardia bannensis]|uniref:DUF4282 domain-containing protein n=1 Tax=Pseudonocardia bannensis TaxID=630973 RepID=A0A848DL22_9PSEU|nr:DUF4282 domain-containing protein [Pseudonocardia bannensis]NMH93427.1 DUF4282 domain-containing protein [Pseudonocardia bannensis]